MSAVSDAPSAPRSLWDETVGERVLLDPLAGDTDVDVAVIGAGLTGLWTAVSLLRGSPGLRLVVLERNDVGFGASGRNGGWASALSPVPVGSMARLHGRQAAIDLERALIDSVYVLEHEIRQHRLEPGAVRGGSISMIRSAYEAERARHRLAEAHAFGFGADDLRWLSANEARRMVDATRVQGALFTPHCLTVQPARLTHGVARLVGELGGHIRRAEVTDVRPGLVHTDRGNVRAGVVLQCTEAYSVTLRSSHRDVIPLYSMMIATEPLSDHIWEQIGLHDRPTFDDFRHMIIYGQRTDDGRFAFGGRGAPYHFASRIRSAYDTNEAVRQRLTTSLRELFPVLGSTRITHHWGGPLAMPRDQHPHVRFDPATGLGSAGGYVGDGVTSTNLAGRTLADLVLGHRSDLVRLPWVGHRSRRWEPEPLRWVGVTAVRRSADVADRAHGWRRPVARAGAAVVKRLTGR